MKKRYDLMDLVFGMLFTVSWYERAGMSSAPWPLYGFIGVGGVVLWLSFIEFTHWSLHWLRGRVWAWFGMEEPRDDDE